MASILQQVLSSKSYSGAVTDEKGSVKELQLGTTDIILQIVVSSYVAGTITAIVEHSIDGVNWTTYDSFTAAIAAGTVEMQIAGTPIGKYVRSSVTTNAAADFDAEIQLAADLLRP